MKNLRAYRPSRFDPGTSSDTATSTQACWKTVYYYRPATFRYRKTQRYLSEEKVFCNWLIRRISSADYHSGHKLDQTPDTESDRCYISCAPKMVHDQCFGPCKNESWILRRHQQYQSPLKETILSQFHTSAILTTYHKKFRNKEHFKVKGCYTTAYPKKPEDMLSCGDKRKTNKSHTLLKEEHDPGIWDYHVCGNGGSELFGSHTIFLISSACVTDIKQTRVELWIL
jgi:hypothetical protein